MTLELLYFLWPLNVLLLLFFFKEMKFLVFSWGKELFFPRSLMKRPDRWSLKAVLEVCSERGSRGGGWGDSEVSR